MKSGRSPSVMHWMAHAYRPALDGIRAVAVLAVIAYHTGIVDLPGGFLGVDVFFVLSGYLITGLLLSEHARAGRVDLLAFWARRARRLMPAAVTLLVVCAIVTSQVTGLASLPARRDDMLATLFYFANWHFIASDQTYFAFFTGVSPLRHAWSLAIEEQFYVFWPLVLPALLALTRRARAGLLWVLGGGIVASAALMALHYDASDPTRAYFGTDTRVFALLLGAALAVVVHRHPGALAGDRARRIARYVALPTVVALGAAFAVMGDQAAFYYRGGALLFAVVSAALIWTVESRAELPLARGLSVRPITWIGRISYGLYLWHWPLKVWIDESSRFESWSHDGRQMFVIALTFVVATVSYYAIEQPFRHGRVPWVRLHRARFAAIAVTCVVLATGVVLQATQVESSAVVEQVTDTSDEPCPAGSPTVGPYAWCMRVEPAQPDAPVVAVVGDSTSRALDPGMRRLAARRGWGYIQTGQNGCSAVPVLVAGRSETGELAPRPGCLQHVADLLADVARVAEPDAWIVYDWTTLGTLVAPDGTLVTVDDPRRAALLTPALDTLLRSLTAGGAPVIYVARPPDGQPVDCAADPGLEECADPRFTTSYPPLRALARIERSVTSAVPGVTYVTITDVLCPDDEQCPATIDGVLARYDGVHFTSTFSRRIAKVIVKRAERAGVELSDGEESTTTSR